MANGDWIRSYPSLFIYTSNGITSSGHIAGFDLDWTLVRTMRGKFPKDVDDITLLPNRISVLKELARRGFTIAIFTNQKSTNNNKVQFNLERVTNGIKLLEEVEIKVIVFMSISDDTYRKPQTGMWSVLKQIIPIKSGFYCGDAAGRPQDFSDSDREFAGNIGVKFYLPEELFPRIERISEIERVGGMERVERVGETENINQIELPSLKSMVILMGMPGSGKTTYYQQSLNPLGYIHISRDELKTIPKMKKMVREALFRDQLVAIDATNARQVHRQEYYDLAKEYGYTVALLYFVGDGSGFNKLRDKPVPGIAYGTYYKYLEEPTPENTPGQLYQIM
jgi:bifunctional polynucleotide phosphatase/kinase